MKIIESTILDKNIVTLITNNVGHENFELIIADATNTEIIRFAVKKEFDSFHISQIHKKLNIIGNGINN